MARAIAASLEIMRGTKKNPLCLPDSEDDLKEAAPNIASNSLHPGPLPLPLCPCGLALLLVLDEGVLLPAKTSHPADEEGLF